MKIKIKDGDWVIAWNYGIECHQVIKVTANLIFYKSPHSNNEFRLRPEDVLFSDKDENVAKLVLEKLVSSSALHSDEVRKSTQRRIERDKHIIACGNATKTKAA